jgi:uncharacterized protein
LHDCPANLTGYIRVAKIRVLKDEVIRQCLLTRWQAERKPMIIDAFAFARNGDERSGEIPVSKLARLDLMSHRGSVQFQAAGFIGLRHRPFIKLDVTGSLVLRCERCLQALDWPLEVHSLLWLAKSDEEADAAPVDEDVYDPVVGSEHFDLNALIEDEILLNLPLPPKHEHCLEPLSAPPDVADSPFAALKALKKGMPN